MKAGQKTSLWRSEAQDQMYPFQNGNQLLGCHQEGWSSRHVRWKAWWVCAALRKSRVCLNTKTNKIGGNWLFGNSENALFYMLWTCVQRMIHFMSTFIYTIKGLTRPPVYLFHNILFILNSFFWISDDQKSYRQRDTSHLLTFQMKFIGTTLMKSFWVPIMRCTRYIFLVDTDVWFFLLPIKLFFWWIFTKTSFFSGPTVRVPIATVWQMQCYIPVLCEIYMK